MIGLVLANEVRTKKVSDAHRALREQYFGLTFEDILILGYNWNREKIDRIMGDEIVSLRRFMYVWEYETGEMKLKDYGLYNTLALANARYRAVFLQKLVRMGYDLTKKLSIKDLEEISKLAENSNTVLYAIKCYLLANHGSNLMKFKGLQPQTGPVHNATKKLFCVKDSNKEHMNRCNTLAKELNVSSTFINTSMYFLG
jgi:hypothetical protein